MDDFELPGPITPRKAPERPTSSDRYIDALLYARYAGLSPSEARELMQDNGTLQNLAEIRDAFDRGTAAGRGNWFVRLFRA